MRLDFFTTVAKFLILRPGWFDNLVVEGLRLPSPSRMWLSFEPLLDQLARPGRFATFEHRAKPDQTAPCQGRDIFLAGAVGRFHPS